jgi:hypothetical protein
MFILCVIIDCLNADSLKTAGFRASRILSSYPNRQFPDPEYWEMVGREMAGKFEDFTPGGIWIVSLYLSDPEGYTLLNFPSPGGSFDWIYFRDSDQNEAWLNHFDTTGVQVWLQVEPGGANIDTLIYLVLNRYKHHPCVVGFGVDVEWYQTYAYSGGRKVSDEEAKRWEQKVKAVDPRYTLFLKHYGQSWMPPSYRRDIIFVDDSQDFTWSGNPLNAMVNEFSSWGQKFSPNPVAFQYGYPNDQGWWSEYSDPAGTIGQALIDNVPNCKGLFWVDFTVTDVFPPTSIGEKRLSPDDIQLLKNYPNPVNPSTTSRYQVSGNPADQGTTRKKLQHYAYPQNVDISVYNPLGQKIVSLFSGQKAAGAYEIVWNGRDSYGRMLTSGTYYCVFKSDYHMEVLKLLLIR